MQSINTWQNATDSYCAKMSVLITVSEISSVSLKIDDWNIGFITVYVDHQAFFRFLKCHVSFFLFFRVITFSNHYHLHNTGTSSRCWSMPSCPLIWRCILSKLNISELMDTYMQNTVKVFFFKKFDNLSEFRIKFLLSEV